jgi:teichuronic acid biosynthesis protein TuaE
MIQKNELKNFLLMLITIASFLSSNFLSITVVSVQLTMYRLLILITLIFVATVLKQSRVEMSQQYEFLIIWMLYALISIIWVKDYGAWFKAIFFIMCGCLITYILCVCLTEKHSIRSMLVGFSIIAVLFIGFGYYESVTGIYLFQGIPLTDAQIVVRRKNIPLFITNGENYYALICCFFFFILIAVYKMIERSVLSKLIVLMMIVSCAYLVYKTESRGVLSGLIVGIIAIMVTSLLQKGRTTIVIVLFLIMLVLGIFYFLFSPPSVINYEQSDVIRLELLRNGFDFLIRTFGFGVGAGNIEYWMAYKSTYYAYGYTNMHNWWMEILSSYGIIVFVLYIRFVIGILKNLFLILLYENDSMISGFAKGLLGWHFAFIVASISASSNLSNEWMWLVFGVSIAFIQNYSVIAKSEEDIIGD